MPRVPERKSSWGHLLPYGRYTVPVVTDHAIDRKPHPDRMDSSPRMEQHSTRHGRPEEPGHFLEYGMSNGRVLGEHGIVGSAPNFHTLCSTISFMPLTNFEHSVYHGWMRLRDRASAPLVKILAALGITPNAISIASL